MTATESSQLHASLKKELHGVTAAPAPTKKPFAWGRWLSVAAGTAAVFLVVFMVLPGLEMGANDSSDATAAAAAPTETTASPTAERELAATEPSESLMAGDSADDFESMEETTAAPAETTTTSAATATTESSSGVADFLPLLGFGELTPEIRDGVIAALMTDADGLRLRYEMTKTATSDAESCFAELATDLGIPATHETLAVGLLAGDDGAERIIVAYVPDNVEDTLLVVVDYPGCTVHETLPIVGTPQG